MRVPEKRRMVSGAGGSGGQDATGAREKRGEGITKKMPGGGK